MSTLQQMTLDQAADLIVSRLRTSVKYAAGEIAAPAPAPAPAPGSFGPLPKSLSDFNPLQNSTHTAMLGGGLGLGMGALSALGSSDSEKRKRWLRHALFGGAMGGLGGAALGVGGRGLRELLAQTQRQSDAANTRTAPSFWERIQRSVDGHLNPFGVVSATPKTDANREATAAASALPNNGSWNALSPISPMLLTGGGAGLGAGIDRNMSAKKVRLHEQGTVRDALMGNKLKGTGKTTGGTTGGTKGIGKINTALRDAGVPEITDQQLSDFKVSKNPKTYDREMQAQHRKANPGRIRTLFGAKPVAPTAPHPRLSKQQFDALHSAAKTKLKVDPKTVPTRRSGIMGGGIGALTGLGLSMLGTPHLSAAERNTMSEAAPLP